MRISRGLAGALQVSLLFAAACGWAQQGGNDLTVHLFVEPLFQKAFGGTSYDLSSDTGSGTSVLSRLEFPTVSFEAGALVGLSIDRGARRVWLVQAQAAHSVIGISASMNDYDWVQYPGYPKIPTSYTYSQDATDTWNASLEAAWTFASAGPFSLALYGLYRYQYASHVESSATGWQYVWNSTANAYDLYGISDSTSDVLEYTLTTHSLGLGLLADVRAFEGFTVTLRAAYTPVYASDRDDHKLRTKLSTASGWGNGLYADLQAKYQLPHIAPGATPYVALDAQLIYYVVSTTQTQYWYGNADASNGAPMGTTISGVGHVITSTQYYAGLHIGVQF